LSDNTRDIDVGAFGRLVGRLGHEDFGDEFYTFFAERLGIDSCTVFKFGAEQTPTCVVANGGLDTSGRERTKIARDVAADYTAEGYRHCPHISLFRAVSDRPVTLLYNPDVLSSRDYRRRYYVRPDVAHELLLAERVKGSLFYVGLYRGQGGRFSQSAADRLGVYAPFILNCLVRHCEVLEALHPKALASRTTNARIREMIPSLRETLLEDSGQLTLREAEVCAWIMVGFCAASIAAGLGISVDTVKTHRKRAYAKLGICSQNELFTRYVSATLPEDIPVAPTTRNRSGRSLPKSGNSNRPRSSAVG
jgi:DNA-binding CsgD family transcriptional regulator